MKKNTGTGAALFLATTTRGRGVLFASCLVCLLLFGLGRSAGASAAKHSPNAAIENAQCFHANAKGRRSSNEDETLCATGRKHQGNSKKREEKEWLGVKSSFWSRRCLMDTTDELRELERRGNSFTETRGGETFREEERMMTVIRMKLRGLFCEAMG